uniref:Uncharacterized protein n=1 Tax=Heterorhabditis bacteriophora TaxID=37862 RepID=A0A1I7WGP2_HETBA
MLSLFSMLLCPLRWRGNGVCYKTYHDKQRQ